MTRLRLGLATGAAAIAIAVGVVLARFTADVVLLVYVLVLGALLLALLARGLRSLLPPAVPFERLLARPATQPEGVAQLQTVERHLRLSVSSNRDLHSLLRPMVRDIVSVRLSRRHGIDLDREPERAEALIGGGKVWELVRPDREAPEDRLSRGWPRSDMEQLVDELEKL